jgi:tight adherence protein B
MISRRLLAAGTVAFGLLATPALAADVQLTPVQRVPFPQRSYVVDIGRDASFTRGQVHLSENGVGIPDFKLRPLAASSVTSAVVLALDASDSMAGAPFKAALAAARNFGSTRTSTERVGVVAFNQGVTVVQRPTLSADDLGASLAKPPPIAYGTHIYDGIQQSLQLLAQAKVATGTLIVLSDGADVGSLTTLDDAIAAARGQNVRIFTVGLRSPAYKSDALRKLATGTGGAYYEAASAVELGPIYQALGTRLASQYLLSYKSSALPRSSVIARVGLDGIGVGTNDYTAPRPSQTAPFHRSFLKRFVLSPAATPLLSLLLAGLIGGFILWLLRRGRTPVASRIDEFLHGVKAPAERLLSTGETVRTRLASNPQAQSWLARLDRELEIAEIQMSSTRLVVFTAIGTALVCVLLGIVSPILFLAGLLVPAGVRGWVKRRLRTVRDEFADQLPASLQVLASAMRAGHSFSGALSIVVDNAHEPSRRELRRAVNDDQLGISMDIALRRVAERMANKDLHQVALLSELQRTAGGNAAEVLDTVVETIRERAEIRRLVRTLTAQGRMARWILTAVPAVAAFFLWLMQPSLMAPLFLTTGGQTALVIAGLMVFTGSVMIQRIVEIKV